VPEPSLIQIKTSAYWYIQWYENGRTKRASTRTADRGEAEAILAAFRLVQASGPIEDLTVAQVLEWYWETYASTELMRPDNTDLAIRNLKPFFGTTLAAECGIGKQQAYVDAKRAQGYGEESIRRDLSTLSAAFRRAEKHEKLSRAPPALTLTPAPPRERWLTRSEVARLFWAMRDKRSRHVLLFARLALYTGARTGAILDLTWDRVNFSTGLIDFRVPGRKETKKRRTIAPMAHLRRALLQAKKRSKTKYVIEYRNQRVDRIYRAFVNRAARVGLEDVSPHVLRHSFATWAVQKGAPIYMVGKALGQTVASTTERYAKHRPKDIEDVMSLVRRK
jgi:integrase